MSLFFYETPNITSPDSKRSTAWNHFVCGRR